MAVKNRDESFTSIDSKIVPTVTNDIHKKLLKEDLFNSVVFRKDVIKNNNSTGSNTILDFSDCDTIVLNQTQSGAVNFTGLENGDIKYLEVNKSTGMVTAFFNEQTEIPSILKDTTKVLYVIYKKNNRQYVKAVNDTVDFATFSECENGINNKIIAPNRLNEIFNVVVHEGVFSNPSDFYTGVGEYVKCIESTVGYDTVNNKYLKTYDFAINLICHTTTPNSDICEFPTITNVDLSSLPDARLIITAPHDRNASHNDIEHTDISITQTGSPAHLKLSADTPHYNDNGTVLNIRGRVFDFELGL